ncbi:MAG: GNAT family N-acetyltransferase [Saprospiraceae bacterium]|nr:GNAT family N-acetyltransferase [Saprospiraceae bacterium]
MSDLTFKVRKATVEDAEAILKHVKTVGDETEFLTFSSEDFKKTLEQEKQIILAHNTSPNQLFFIAEHNGSIIGVSNLMASQKPRLRHIGEFGISVLKSYWGKGVGTAMIKFMISWAKEGGIITKINLIVQKNNFGAVALYLKLGFEKEGDLRRALKINGKYYDAYYMGMLL